MKRMMAVVVIVSFWLTVVALAVPITMAAYGPVVFRPVVGTLIKLVDPSYVVPESQAGEITDVSEALAFLREFGSWQFYAIWFGIMFFAQVTLLVVPVKAASARPISRWMMLWPVLGTGLMMGVLMLGGFFIVTETLSWFEAVELPSYVAWAVWITPLAMWVVWTIVFFRLSRGREPRGVVTQQCRYLIIGSLLELSLACITHLISRYRGVCCTGLFSFLAIVTGISVLFLAYGPGIYFLLVERWERRRAQAASEPTTPTNAAG